MPDPTQQPSATAPTAPAPPPDGAGSELSPEHAALAEKYMQHCYNKNPVFKRMYDKAEQEMQAPAPDAPGATGATGAPPAEPVRNAAAAGPGGGNTFLPAHEPQRNSGSDELRGSNQAGQIRSIWAKDPHGDYHPDQHARQGSPDRFARELAVRDQQIADLQRENRQNRYHKVLSDLQRGSDQELGIDLDIAAELTIAQDLSQQQFDGYVERMKKNYRRVQRDPTQHPGPADLRPVPGGPARNVRPGQPVRHSKAQVDRAVEIVTASEGKVEYSDALKQAATEVQ